MFYLKLTLQMEADRKIEWKRKSRFYLKYGQNLERANETESIRKKRSRTKGESERAGKGRAAFRWKPKKRIRFQLDEHAAVAFMSNLPPAESKLPAAASKFPVMSTSWKRRFPATTAREKNEFWAT